MDINFDPSLEYERILYLESLTVLENCTCEISKTEVCKFCQEEINIINDQKYLDKIEQEYDEQIDVFYI